MTNKHYLALFVLASFVYFIVALTQQFPGYMDADYYLTNARLIYQGRGFYEPFIWNYLTNPPGLPAVAFTYWMPLTSLLGAASMFIFHSEVFITSRILLILIGAGVAPLSAYLCMLLTENHVMALMAGLLAMLPGFYLVFLTTTDAFGLYMVLGGAFLIIIQRLFSNRSMFVSAICLGVIAGLLHLSRADGLVWFASGIGVIFVFWFSNGRKLRRLLLAYLMYGVGYMAMMAVWYGRNLQLLGSLFPSGGSKTLWLALYDQIYIYPASLLTFENWLKTGWGSILGARWWATTQNLQTFLAVQGLVFLLPLILLGLWRHRRSAAVRTGAVVWLCFFAMFTLILPFPGVRGSFYHAGASLQVLFWAVIPSGLEVLLEFGARLRNWNIARARKVFQAGAVMLAAVFTILISMNNLGFNSNKAWGGYLQKYVDVGVALDTLDPSRQSVVMVNNPPGFYLATGRQAIAIPYADAEEVLSAANRYGASYLMLEPNTNFQEIYEEPQKVNWMDFVTSVDQIQLFKLPK